VSPGPDPREDVADVGRTDQVAIGRSKVLPQITSANTRSAPADSGRVLWLAKSWSSVLTRAQSAAHGFAHCRRKLGGTPASSAAPELVTWPLRLPLRRVAVAPRLHGFEGQLVPFTTLCESHYRRTRSESVANAARTFEINPERPLADLSVYDHFAPMVVGPGQCGGSP
jgi:hypothetical protein